ncbi:hypothetical protein C6341_g22729 [Phytophthora cactorum]|nr:hypothetical protein C6341_g22729 [Phytophthora cactorum]
MVRDYQRWMDGVDIHDQLRLQRCSLQMQTWCKKYYKSTFLGLVDVAIVNAYIIFREAQKRNADTPISHAEFLIQLHAEMFDLSEKDFAEHPTPQTTAVGEEPPPLPHGHEPQECPEYQVVNGVRKRRQRQCKVCSVLKRRVEERRATKYYCAACSKSDKARIWPQHYPGNAMSCYQIWHHKGGNGAKRPTPRCRRGFQSREAGETEAAGKRKRRRQSGDEVEEEDRDDEHSGSKAESSGDVEEANESE